MSGKNFRLSQKKEAALSEIISNEIDVAKGNLLKIIDDSSLGNRADKVLRDLKTSLLVQIVNELA